MINYKVAFVLRPIDDFSGKGIVKKKFLFTVNGVRYKPIEKAEGLYVFLEPMEKSVSLGIIGNEYNQCSVTVEKDKLNPTEPIAEVRLYARAGKDLPYRYELVNGRIEDKKIHFPIEVGAIREKETGLVLKKVKEADGITTISCNGFTKENLIGKSFAMESGKNVDVFILAEKTGINEYRVEGHLKGKHIAGSKILRAYRSVTDEMGYYAIPVEVGEANAIAKVIVMQKS